VVLGIESCRTENSLDGLGARREHLKFLSAVLPRDLISRPKGQATTTVCVPMEDRLTEDLLGTEY
jgi:hypothetical protein